ncbi:hypothetical protein [Acetivibrio clariflavus]|uniref:Uncharacterized protein n=1 Tax=Acetivibrio clariflavus (strain DSM 19732 / NBRC 101661 / EBR45) TaxID=720554 RepID=G8M3A9_ACECE|nr:hypothetical protein [Acetivibrio clariflavus]AEV70429.1 hypothetical protein Clocl_3993 [Acetivibrio clariflavus DSM 19732]
MKNNPNKKAVLKDIVTEETVAVYPYNVEGSQEEIEKKVFDWYYAQGCSNEEQLPKLFVDIVSE